MRIEPFSLALDPPLATASGDLEAREGYLVAIEHAGVEGVGEATPLPGWTESRSACLDALERAEEIAEHTDWGIALARTGEPAARHGLALALSAARAQAADQPLYRHLGPDVPVRHVPVNATLDETAPADLARAARDAVASGFRSLKIKCGIGQLADDVSRLRAVRETVDARVNLRIDANGSWDRETARDAFDAFANLDVDYVEQPLPPADLDGLARLRGGDVGVAVDETLIEHSFAAVREAGAADVVVIKPMVVGGPDRAVELASRARAAGIEPIVSTTVDAVVARTGAVHVAATIPEVRACGLATGSRLATDLATDPAPVEDGAVFVPQSKGLGLAERPRT